MGDPEKADHSLLPKFDHMDEESSSAGAGYLRINADYRLEIDNILDLSHNEYLHPIFLSLAVSRAKVSHKLDGDKVCSYRDIVDDGEAPDFIRTVYEIPDSIKTMDRWLYVSWEAPALMSLYASVRCSSWNS